MAKGFGVKKNNSWVADPALRGALAREIRCARLRREIRLKRMAKMVSAPTWMQEMSREEAQSIFLAECRALYAAFEAADAAVAGRAKQNVRAWQMAHAANMGLQAN